MLAEGLLLCNLILAQDVPRRVLTCLAFCSFGFFLCRLPLVAASPARQPFFGLLAGSSTWPFWEDKYFGRLERSNLSEKPAVRLLSNRTAKRGADLAYVGAFVLSHFSCGHHFLPLTLAGQTVALRAAAYGKGGLRCRHTTCPTTGSADIVQGVKPPGRLVGPGAGRRNEITHSRHETYRIDKKR
jgi:hypothetical protein